MTTAPKLPLRRGRERVSAWARRDPESLLNACGSVRASSPADALSDLPFAHVEGSRPDDRTSTARTDQTGCPMTRPRAACVAATSSVSVGSSSEESSVAWSSAIQSGPFVQWACGRPVASPRRGRRAGPRGRQRATTLGRYHRHSGDSQGPSGPTPTPGLDPCGRGISVRSSWRPSGVVNGGR